jgi:hypothetical protein
LERKDLEWSSDELARNFLARRIVEFRELSLTSPGAPTTSFVISMLEYTEILMSTPGCFAHPFL